MFSPGGWLSNYRWSPAVVVVELLRFPGNRPAVVLGARRARAASARGGAGVVPSAAGAPQPARRRGDRPGGDVGLAGGESSGALGGPLVQSLAAATVILLLVFAVRERLLMRLDAWIYPETADHWIRTRRP